MIVLFEPVFRILKAFNLDCNEFLILRFTSYEIAKHQNAMHVRASPGAHRFRKDLVEK